MSHLALATALARAVRWAKAVARGHLSLRPRGPYMHMYLRFGLRGHLPLLSRYGPCMHGRRRRRLVVADSGESIGRRMGEADLYTAKALGQCTVLPPLVVVVIFVDIIRENSGARAPPRFFFHSTAVLCYDSSLSEKINDVLLSEDNKTKLDEAHILDVVVSDKDTNGVKVMLCSSGRYDRAKQTLSELLLTVVGPPSLHVTSYEICCCCCCYINNDLRTKAPGAGPPKRGCCETTNHMRKNGDGRRR